MIRRVKFGKIFSTIFLTCLIWVWADLAKTENASFSNASILVDKSASRNLLITFDNKPTASIKKIELKGASSRISELKRQLSNGIIDLQFFFDPRNQPIPSSGDFQLDVGSFLKKNDKFRHTGLSVEGCDPNIINVKVLKLVEKSLTVKCLDENSQIIKTESIEPSKVNVFVPQDWNIYNKFAYITLSRAEKNQARISPVTQKTPYVTLAPGQKKDASETVQVKLPPSEKDLAEYNITSATVGIVFSPVLVGKYNVELLNLPDMASVSIKATQSAKNAYEQQPYKMTLYILDSDKKDAGKQLKRKVIYNFPEEFLRKDEIQLNQPPTQAEFKLTPIPPANNNNLPQTGQ